MRRPAVCLGHTGLIYLIGLGPVVVRPVFSVDQGLGADRHIGQSVAPDVAPLCEAAMPYRHQGDLVRRPVCRPALSVDRRPRVFCPLTVRMERVLSPLDKGGGVIHTLTAPAPSVGRPRAVVLPLAKVQGGRPHALGQAKVMRHLAL